MCSKEKEPFYRKVSGDKDKAPGSWFIPGLTAISIKVAEVKGPI